MAEGSENRIGEVRQRRGWRQVELAEKLSMSRGQLANIESGTRKVDLPELRRIGGVLGCSLVELLLPADAPDQPDMQEAELLADLRAMPGYDSRLILAAAKGVTQACQAVMAVSAAPKALDGDPRLVRRLADTWNNLDDTARDKAVGLLDAARQFAR